MICSNLYSTLCALTLAPLKELMLWFGKLLVIGGKADLLNLALHLPFLFVKLAMIFFLTGQEWSNEEPAA